MNCVARSVAITAAMGVALAGCASDKLNTALGTPKNPTQIFASPNDSKTASSVAASSRTAKHPKDDQSVFIMANYTILKNAIDGEPTKTGKPPEMRIYLGAGFALADTYCSQFFVKTDEAYRRRRFGRTLTNDAGTAVTTLLGLANAGQTAVTALAAVTGLADSAWRNYDDSFVVSPELATVRSLVLAAQDNFRARTVGPGIGLPADYGTAQSIIRRYAEFCSFLGMKALLEQSSSQQRDQLNEETEKKKDPDAKKDEEKSADTKGDGKGKIAGQPKGKPVGSTSQAVPAVVTPPAPSPAAATPGLATNSPSPGL